MDNSFAFLGDKSFIDVNEFTKIQEDFSSEMFLTVCQTLPITPCR